jgi:adenosine deaminase
MMTSLSGILFSLTATASAATLSEKLSAQWARYEAAQSELQNTFPAPVTRDRWENLLALPSEMALTAHDLEELKLSQEQRIEEARKKARASSLIDLDRLRTLPSAESQKAIASFCAEMPKGGMLHIHPSGTLKQTTVEKLLRHDDPTLNFGAIITKQSSALNTDELSFLQAQSTKAAYSKLTPDSQKRLMDFYVLPPGTYPFPRFDVSFQFLGYIMQSDDDYLTVFDDFSQRAAQEGVSYVEFTWNIDPEDFPFLEGLVKRIEEKTGIIVRFNKAFSRGQPQEKLLAQAQALVSSSSPAVVGIDLLGNETLTPALERGQGEYTAVVKANQAGKSHLHLTMHAGELGDPRNPRDAILLGAERLGHGVKLMDDPVTLEYAAHKKTAVEVNLSSNLKLRAIDDLKRHPFLKYLRLGIPVSLSTDDEGILDTEINQECQVAIRESDVTYAELKQMAFNSIETSFADPATRATLLSRLKESFERFELSKKQTIAQ